MAIRSFLTGRVGTRATGAVPLVLRRAADWFKSPRPYLMFAGFGCSGSGS